MRKKELEARVAELEEALELEKLNRSAAEETVESLDKELEEALDNLAIAEFNFRQADIRGDASEAQKVGLSGLNDVLSSIDPKKITDPVNVLKFVQSTASAQMKALVSTTEQTNAGLEARSRSFSADREEGLPLDGSILADILRSISKAD